MADSISAVRARMTTEAQANGGRPWGEFEAGIQVLKDNLGAISGVSAANLDTNQVTASTTAGTLVIARPTRLSVLFRNLDAAISVYVGKATVTAGNGMLLRAGESVVFSSVGLIQVIAASGNPVVAYADEYN